MPPGSSVKKTKKWSPAALEDMADMVASLERVPKERRSELGYWLFERALGRTDPAIWARLARIGSRVPAYASAHYVVTPAVVEPWIEHLLRQNWDLLPTAKWGIIQLARKTEDRTRNINEALRQSVEQRLLKENTQSDWVRLVTEWVPPKESEQAAFLGEALPIGLRWLL